MGTPKQHGNIIPGVRYQDASAAIDWLCEAFGFREHLVVPDETGGIAHAQLKLGNGMIMLGSARDDEYGRLLGLPAELGKVTQAAYVVVSDIAAHYAHAREAGAEIVMELEAQDYGGEIYSARDLEGHLWSFGSYDPWAED